MTIRIQKYINVSTAVFGKIANFWCFLGEGMAFESLYNRT
jgi:hypothetical protein